MTQDQNTGVPLNEAVSCRCYISGPMSGVVDNNAKAFDERKAKLQNVGFAVVSPVDLDRATAVVPAYADCLRRDIRAMLDCTHISYLPGSERSTGAMVERTIAEVIGLEEVNEYGEPIRRRSVLDIASSLTGGDRFQMYGHPAEDFTRTAAIWTALLGHPINAEQVGLCMVGLKLSREVNRHKDDNLIDAAGYIRTIEMVYEYREQQRRDSERAKVDAQQDAQRGCRGACQAEA